MSRLLSAYIIGWAIVLGALIVGGHGNWIAFMAINERPEYFATTAIFLWVFYSVPCAVIFIVAFFLGPRRR